MYKYDSSLNQLILNVKLNLESTMRTCRYWSNGQLCRHGISCHFKHKSDDRCIYDTFGCVDFANDCCNYTHQNNYHTNQLLLNNNVFNNKQNIKNNNFNNNFNRNNIDCNNYDNINNTNILNIDNNFSLNNNGIKNYQNNKRNNCNDLNNSNCNNCNDNNSIGNGNNGDELLHTPVLGSVNASVDARDDINNKNENEISMIVNINSKCEDYTKCQIINGHEWESQVETLL